MKKQWLIVLLFSTLMSLAACSRGPFNISGRLLDAETGESLTTGSLILCPMTEDNTCVLSVGLVASVADTDDGQFHFDNVMTGKFAVFYSSSNALRGEWDTRVIDFNPPQNIQKLTVPPLVYSVGHSLNAKKLETCALQIVMNFSPQGQMVAMAANGYVHYPEQELTMIVRDQQPLLIEINGSRTIDISTWDTARDCNVEDFNPLPN